MFTRVFPRLAAATCIGLFASVMRVRVIVLILVLRHPTQNQRISNRKSGVSFYGTLLLFTKKRKVLLLHRWHYAIELEDAKNKKSSSGCYS